MGFQFADQLFWGKEICAGLQCSFLFKLRVVRLQCSFQGTARGVGCKKDWPIEIVYAPRPEQFQ